MRRSCQTTFCVTQVHPDHVQIIDEKKQAEWHARTQSAAHESALEQLRDAVHQSRMAFEHAEQLHNQQQSLCSNQSKARVRRAAKTLQRAKAALQCFQSLDYHVDVPYDSIYSFRLALGNGLSIVH